MWAQSNKKVIFNESNIRSYVKACDSISVQPNTEAVVFLRGSFVPFLAKAVRNPTLLEHMHFAPASKFLLESTNNFRVFLRNYFTTVLPRYQNRSLNLLIIDEAKSGSAISRLSGLLHAELSSLQNQYVEDKLKRLAGRPSDLSKISSKALQNLGHQHDESNKFLDEIMRKVNLGNLKLIKDNGDFTEEGAFLLKLFVEHGFIPKKEADDLFHHRVLVEARLAAEFDPNHKPNESHPYYSIPKGAHPNSFKTMEKLASLRDLPVVFPRLKSWFIIGHDKLPQKDFVEFSNLELNEDTHRPIMQKSALYNAAFATLVNYRLSKLLSHLGKNKKEMLQTLGVLSERQKEKQSAEKYRFASVRSQPFLLSSTSPEDRHLIADVILAASVFGRLKILIYTLHGRDSFITARSYTAAKEKGEIKQIDVNSIITMDNPATPVFYERTSDEKGFTPHAFVEPTEDFERLSERLVFHLGIRKADYEKALHLMIPKVRRDRTFITTKLPIDFREFD
ncbi:MAG: hypothetical protein QXR53_00810 [Candidatus Norongarragalinales archaeon]